MTIPTKLFIDGAYRSPVAGRPTPLVNPATEAVFAEVDSATQADINAAVESAQKAWENGWRDMAPGKRTEILFNVARVLRENLESLAQLEMQQIGKPIADARDEIGLGARVFEFYAGAVTKFYGQTIPVSRGGIDFTLRQSMGVVACIVPWNFPFPIACWKTAPALAAGNCVILKPASISPLTAIALVFAIFQLNPAPFCLLDEVDAPLDDANIGRFNEMVREMSTISQFIIITHNKATMQVADTLYGITMEEPGASRVVSVRLH